ncbi:hypothetical protein D3C76_926940 [compost metagenome]
MFNKYVPKYELFDIVFISDIFNAESSVTLVGTIYVPVIPNSLLMFLPHIYMPSSFFAYLTPLFAYKYETPSNNFIKVFLS